MEVERTELGEDPAALARDLRAGGPGGDAAVEGRVREIIDRVDRDGDEAVLALTSALDTGGGAPEPLRVGAGELAAARRDIPPELEDALERAAANVRAVAEAEIGADTEVTGAEGQRIRVRELPVRRAAVYAPGGRAPYPSTVVMGAVTAQVAGVEEVVVCAPPGPAGAHPAILGACALLGVEEVYRMGGAQAVAALALGTRAVAAVDVIVGPGNAYVQEAKRLLAHRVGIDGFAGPSELLVLAGPGAEAPLVALDLLAQAEHGPGSIVALVATEPAVLDAVAAELDRLDATAATADRCVLALAASAEAALAFAEALAPEHLELVGAEAEALAPRVSRAGCLFVGATGATAFGDYVAGSNHVLPTGGAARFASGLSPRHFRRRMTEVRIGDAAAALAGPGAVIARAEGFERHAESMEARMGENPAP